MSLMKVEKSKAAEPDCFIVSVEKKTIRKPVTVNDASPSPSSTPRGSQSYYDAQAASSSQNSATYRASRVIRSFSSQPETPRKRGRSRSPVGTPPSSNKRNRTLSAVGSTPSGSPPNFYDAESYQGDGDELTTGDRYIFSPHAASPPIPSGSSLMSSYLSPPVPLRLGVSSSQRHRSSTSSPPTASPSPSQQRPPVKTIIKTEDPFLSPASSFQSSSQSSSQSLPRIVRNPSWNFEIDREGVFTCLYKHWTESIPAVLPKKGPRCRKCDRPSKLNFVGEDSETGNAGRPYYKCSCKEWITWADLEGCDPDNEDCYCGKGKRTRTNVCGGDKKYPGRKFWKCANGVCKFWEWEVEWEWKERRLEQEAEARDAAEVPLPEGDDW